MKKSEYMERAFAAFNEGKISEEIFDSMIMNANVFCDDDDDDERLPKSYAEVEYDDFDDPEAIDGARWDDMNYRHYMER